MAAELENEEQHIVGEITERKVPACATGFYFYCKCVHSWKGRPDNTAVWASDNGTHLWASDNIGFPRKKRKS